MDKVYFYNSKFLQFMVSASRFEAFDLIGLGFMAYQPFEVIYRQFLFIYDL